MPSDVMHGGRRGSIYNWRVKAASREVFSSPKKLDCVIFIRAAKGKVDGKKLRLIPPNI